jgi:hypothetical protein
MDWFLIFLVVVISLLTIIFLAVGIQFLLVLRSVKKTLKYLDNTLGLLSHVTFNLTNPLSDVKSLGQGVKTGLQVAEYVFTWLKERKPSDHEQSNR